MARRRKQNQSFVHDLLESPWQVSIAVGVAVFIGLKWILPDIGAGNMFLAPIAQAFSKMAWLFSGFFFAIGALVYVKTMTSRPKPSPTWSKTTASHDPASGWRPPPWAPSNTSAQQTSSEVSTSPDGQQLASVQEQEDSSATEVKPIEWSIELIRDIEWKRFEDVCQKFYELKGIRSETTPLGPDGGIDIRLYQDESGQATSIVQCKAWGERFVGVKPVRELLGVMTHEKISKAFFMTSGRFSDDAKEVAKSNRITLIDGEMLLMMIKRLPEADQQRLLSFATEGDYKVPTCPSCGIKMKRVSGKAGRSDFWGCRHYPRCRQMLGMRREAER